MSFKRGSISNSPNVFKYQMADKNAETPLSPTATQHDSLPSKVPDTDQASLSLSGASVGLSTQKSQDSDVEIQHSTYSSKFSGYLLKKRKWPLNGWHKRFFVVEGDLLRYAKNERLFSRGKYKGTVNLLQAAISVNVDNTRMDLDAGQDIYHLRATNRQHFYDWVDQIKYHRHLASTKLKSGVDGQADSFGRNIHEELYSLRTNVDSLRTLLHELKSLHLMEKGSPKIRRDKSAASDLNDSNSSLPSSGDHKDKMKKLMRFGFRRTSNPTKDVETEESRFSSQAETFLLVADEIHQNILTMMNCLTFERLGALQGNQLDDTHMASRYHSLDVSFQRLVKENFELKKRVEGCSCTNALDGKNLPGESSTPVKPLWHHHATESIYSDISATQWFDALSGNNDDLETSDDDDSVVSVEEEAYRSDEENDRGYVDIENAYFLDYKTADLEGRRSSSLSRPKDHINFPHNWNQSLTDPVESDRMGKSPVEKAVLEQENKQQQQSGHSKQIPSSSAIYMDESLNNFWDLLSLQAGTKERKRRTCLPSFATTTDISMWSLMKNAIGKDLSRISLPVSLNEPLNALQKVCEELEFCYLLRKANECQDPIERLVYVATFAVTGYASTFFRTGMKPFNPLLGETYECVREDLGFRFIAEQVSHHPPISACYADSKDFLFWENMQVKNKFWGKSAELYPCGNVHVKLNGHNETYRWSKVTSVIHNILSGKRYCDHYGEMVVFHETLGLKCVINFKKSGYFNTKPRNEISGNVMDSKGVVCKRIFGKWSEEIIVEDLETFQTHILWTNKQPPRDYEKYYGFTQFALELNQLFPEDKELLPHTDTRFRPDQHYMEEGELKLAAEHKERVENIQRIARKRREDNHEEYSPIYFQLVDESRESEHPEYIYKHNYWSESPEIPNGLLTKCIPALW